jgi:hypothetical protein
MACRPVRGARGISRDYYDLAIVGDRVDSASVTPASLIGTLEGSYVLDKAL